MLIHTWPLKEKGLESDSCPQPELSSQAPGCPREAAAPPAHLSTLPWLCFSSRVPGASAHTGPQKLSDWPKGGAAWIKGRFKPGIQAP